jgi:hypothetical protein
MGYDATVGRRNTTGQAQQTQALSFAGSTAKLQKALKMEKADPNSRDCAALPRGPLGAGKFQTTSSSILGRQSGRPLSGQLDGQTETWPTLSY